jgi:tyrosyl-tRNA synthetase
MTEVNEVVVVSQDKLTNSSIDIISLMMVCGISPGGATARRVIRFGSVFVNGNQVADESDIVTKEMLIEGVELRMGKKIHIKAVLNNDTR